MIETTPSSMSLGPLERRSDFENNPKGQYKYWHIELTASEKMLSRFHKQGDEIVKRFLGERTRHRAAENAPFQLNLFYANTVTLESNLYGNVPRIDVSRRYADSHDDVGRVAAEMVERFLNIDVAERGEEIEDVLRTCLNDYLTVGLAVPRVRYAAEFTQVTGIDGQPIDVLQSEDVLTEYVHWRDVRWGWSRCWKDIPWIAFRSYMTREEVAERFSEDASKRLQYKAQQALDEDNQMTGTADSWQKAEVWEVWDKVKRQVIWVSLGYDRVLDTKDDPLKLTHFWPCPRFFAANVTSTLFIPVADFHLVQDLYNEVDKLQTRIAIITEAVKVVGVYDASAESLKRMLKEGTDNDLIPVDNWAMFAEKGGIQGTVDWFPIQDVVGALVQLIQMRDQTIQLLQQTSGMADVMRGGLQNQYEGVGQTQIKAQYGSIRIQALQERFAQFASDLMQLKAEVIARHMEPETIVRRSNAMHLLPDDHDKIGPAIQLIKNPDQAKLQIKIRPESIAMVDYAQLKAERSEYITALATFMQSAAPLLEMDAQAQPVLMRLLQWGLAGFKGASEIEGVLDKAIEQAEQRAKQAQQAQAQQAQQPPPEVQIEQMRQQFQMQLEQFKAQAEMQKIQAKAQADTGTRHADMQADIQTLIQEHQAEVERLQLEMITTLTEIKAKMQADTEKERAQAEANILQSQAQAQAEVQKDAASAEIDLMADAVKTQHKIDEIQSSSEAKMRELQKQSKLKKDNDNGSVDPTS